MRAVFASPEGLAIREVQPPNPGPDQVLVRIGAAAMNQADLMIIKGASHGGWGQAGLALGLEWTGEIVAVGAAVSKWRTGERVMAAGPGAFAEYAVASERQLYAVPHQTTYAQAASLPVALQTMHDALSTNGLLKPGQSVLIQGAGSAMGLIGMQVAKYLGASLVIGTSRSNERCDRIKEFGADLALNTKDPDWTARVLQATAGQGVDLLIDLAAGPLANANLQATRVGGRIVNVGRMAGETGEFNFDLHSQRRISYVGVSFRSRTFEETAEVIERASAVLAPGLAAGAFQMPIDAIYRLDEAQLAVERLADNAHFGKIVLSIAEDRS